MPSLPAKLPITQSYIAANCLHAKAKKAKALGLHGHQIRIAGDRHGSAAVLWRGGRDSGLVRNGEGASAQAQDRERAVVTAILHSGHDNGFANLNRGTRVDYIAVCCARSIL